MTALAPGWAAPPVVTAFTALRTGGTSAGAYDSLNLGAHVGDDPERVALNRSLVRATRGWKSEPLWLDQVHGSTVVRAEAAPFPAPPRADGAVTNLPGRPLVVMTADCLPVLACDRAGTVVGAFHAGWRGLLEGILEAGLAALGRPPEDLLAWIGPCIGPTSYQVGSDVRNAYLGSDPGHEAEFVPDGPDHWKFDLAGAAVRRLQAARVEVTRSSWDTYRDADLFFSHRRSAPCGRIGTFICLQTPMP